MGITYAQNYTTAEQLEINAASNLGNWQQNFDINIIQQKVNNATYENVGNNAINGENNILTPQESDFYSNYVYSQNRNVLADFIPTAGATETFNVATGDFFFDPGGPGGSIDTDGVPGNYPNCNCITTTTLVGADEVTFNDFYVFSTFDWLRIYDGADNSAPLLFENDLTTTITYADFIAANGGSASIVSTGGMLTFEFRSSTVVDRLGYDVEITNGSGGGGGGAMACNQEHTAAGSAAGSGVGSSLDSDFKTAADITVAAGENFTIDAITASFLTFAPSDPPVNATVTYYEDAAGFPGTMIGTETLVPTIVSAMPWVNPVADVYETSLAITPFTFVGDMAADTKYWIEIAMGTATAQGTVFWEGTTDTTIQGEPAVQFDATTGNWTVPLNGTTGLPQDNQEVIYNFSGDCEAIGGGGSGDCFITDSTAVPFEIDPGGTQTADCAVAPNLVPVTITETGIIGTDYDLQTVTVDIEHTFSGDLDLSLVAPDGTTLDLALSLGGGTDDAYNGTQFQDGGADISAATAPFGVGPYEATGGAFSVAFAGVSIAGDWQLQVCDGAGGDTGQVLQFSIEFCPPGAGPTNDECDFAINVECGDVVTGDTSDDTDSGGNAAPDEFFKFTGDGVAQDVTISLCDGGTAYDSLLRVFTDCTLTTEIASNDDSCGLQSELEFESDGVSTYYIMVEGFGSNSGAFSLAVTCASPVENDLCENAIEIDCGASVTGTTIAATIDNDVAGANCGTDITAPGVWYAFTDSSGLPGTALATLCNGTDYDSKISVFSGDCSALVCIDGNDDDCGLQSSVTFPTDGASTYYILVHGFGANTGNFTLDVTCMPTPPPNDMIANSIDVDEIGFPYTDPAVAMPAATLEAGDPAGCSINGSAGVWYNFVAGGSGTATASITSPGGASAVIFYTAPDENASETDLVHVDQFNNQCVGGTSASINTLAGQAYYVFVVNTGAITDIVIDGTLLGTNENTIEGFAFYPNPANDQLNVTAKDTIDSLILFNVLGQKVIDQNVGATSSQLDVSSLPTGTYIMKVSVNGEIGTYKVIKQ
ncbi:hypothetical protein ULMS_21580 [Patiriisocius marinistellae]|uniref:P/Homo B domain-containing protein n=2 Tax=Patiriisocius marinistellae TaxID=2494560 RepID=A0A5J4FWR9_9FLAO|nr:hypothetical protein ULMS_21580 [Patiriisocius marinistellae]